VFYGVGWVENIACAGQEAERQRVEQESALGLASLAPGSGGRKRAAVGGLRGKGQQG